MFRKLLERFSAPWRTPDTSGFLFRFLAMSLSGSNGCSSRFESTPKSYEQAEMRRCSTFALKAMNSVVPYVKMLARADRVPHLILLAKLCG